MRAGGGVLRSILIAFGAGCAVGFGLAALLVLTQGWPVGLCGSLGAGMLVARRPGWGSPLARPADPGAGLLISLITPLAAWRVAPLALVGL